jgi:hypothetical protein
LNEGFLSSRVTDAVTGELGRQLPLQALIRGASIRVFPQAITKCEVAGPLRVVGSHDVDKSDPVPRPAILIHHEQVAAAGTLVTAVDAAQRFQQADNAVNRDVPADPYRDIDDWLSGQAGNRRRADMLDSDVEAGQRGPQLGR